MRRSWPAFLHHPRSSAGPAEASGLESLDETVGWVWPTASYRLVGRRERPGDADQLVALPTLARPTVLVPLRPRSAAAEVLASHRSSHSRRQRVERRALMALGRVGAADLLPQRFAVLDDATTEQDSLSVLLERVVGEPSVIGVHLGPPRANRKPILQVVGRSGRTRAFAKLGINDLTRELVRAETAALTALAAVSFTRLQLPRILYAGPWRDHQLLVLAPVPTSGSEEQPDLLRHAMVELCTAFGTREEPLAGSGYWRDLGSRVAALASPMAEGLRGAMTELAAPASQERLRFGSWHGDWTRWNMSYSRHQVVAWDWERFATGVPAGFDAFHYEFQTIVRRRELTPREALRATMARADAIVSPFGVAPDSTGWVLAAYLLEIGSRYLHDRQDEAGARLGDLTTWLLPELSTLVRRLAGEPGR